MKQKPDLVKLLFVVGMKRHMGRSSLFLAALIIAATPISAIAGTKTAPVGSPGEYYRQGDGPPSGLASATRNGAPLAGVSPPELPVKYPACNPALQTSNPPVFTFGSATCARCCSEPDKILADLMRGPDPFGRDSLDEWYINTFWPPLQAKIASMTNLFATNIERQNAQLGTFFEAANNVRSAGALQKGQAIAAKKFATSEALCRFATLAEGLPSSEANTDAIKITMSTRSLDRQLLNKGSISGEDKKGLLRGQDADKKARWRNYESVFCDPSDDNGQLTKVCKTTSDEQYNRDISYTRTLDQPLTLDIGTGVGVTKDVQNLNGLASNLYASDVMSKSFSDADISNMGSADSIRKYMIFRSAIAKRAVAENSFSSIAALKAKGTPATAAATRRLLIELGMSEDEAKTFVSDNPSYYEQMEALTKKLYQSPAFYVNLMEGSPNVERQQAAMKSLELMQQRDIYKSMQRSEIMMATLLDVYLSRRQGEINARLGKSQ